MSSEEEDVDWGEDFDLEEEDGEIPRPLQVIGLRADPTAQEENWDVDFDLGSDEEEDTRLTASIANLGSLIRPRNRSRIGPSSQKNRHGTQPASLSDGKTPLASLAGNLRGLLDSLVPPSDLTTLKPSDSPRPQATKQELEVAIKRKGKDKLAEFAALKDLAVVLFKLEGNAQEAQLLLSRAQEVLKQAKKADILKN
ncbi:hypothetical protein QOT17_001996 [Balamuthia mandrillaris]